MDNAKIDFILDIFRTLSNELPENMLYRENGDGMELKTLESIGNCLSPDLQSDGWNLIAAAVPEAA